MEFTVNACFFERDLKQITNNNLKAPFCHEFRDFKFSLILHDHQHPTCPAAGEEVGARSCECRPFEAALRRLGCTLGHGAAQALGQPDVAGL